MGSLVRYDFDGSVARITMDDGKVNVLSQEMLAEVNDALNRAEANAAIVALAGRAGVFSAGFDLKVLRAGGPSARTMLRAGFELAERILSFPMPVVIACTGHAVAMGVFLMLSGDYRIGVAGPYKITANEVAIGVTLPRAAIEICRQRLTPAHFNRATVLAEVFPPAGAVAGRLSGPGCGGRRVRPGASYGASRHRAAGHDGPRGDQAAGQEAGACGHSRGH